MASYLIEFRFQSAKIKRYLKGMIYDINKKFRVGKKKSVPHVTLVGSFTTRNEKRLISDFARVCSETKLMKLKGKGFGTFDSNRVVYVKIGAGDKLNEFRIRLVENIRPYCTLQSQDRRKSVDKFGYHATLAMKLSEKKFTRIKSYIHTKQPPTFSQRVMRITLLKKGKILREYDFLQRRLLNRRQALNRQITRKSKELLRRYFEGTYDPDSKIHKFKDRKIPSLWEKIKSFFGALLKDQTRRKEPKKQRVERRSRRRPKKKRVRRISRKRPRKRKFKRRDRRSKKRRRR